MFNIDQETLLKAARNKYGKEVAISPPYWVDHEIIRVGVSPDGGSTSFGANYYYQEGCFR